MRHPPGESRFEDRVEDFSSKSRRLARRGSSRARSFIKARPILAVALGVGAGVFLALLLSPRR